jgi:hypothetical protein
MFGESPENYSPSDFVKARLQNGPERQRSWRNKELAK